MKNLLFLFVTLGSISLIARPVTSVAQNPSHPDEIQEYFHSIELKGTYEVYLSQGDVSNYRVEGKRESLDIHVVDGVLRIQNAGKTWGGGDAVIYIQVAELRSLSSSGAVELETQGIIVTDDVKLRFAGASEVIINLEAKHVKMETAGASEVEIKGSAMYADFHTVGATEVDAVSFKVRSLGIETAGASELEVYVTDELKVKARGASEINFRGNPEHIHRDLKGATSLEAI